MRTRSEYHPRWLGSYLLLAVGLCLPALGGCVEGRSSTHELEHVVPEHWPGSLSDAADKIESRLASLASSPPTAVQICVELKEIIEWLPEIAADTAMREDDWNVIYADCVQLETLMKNSGDMRKAEEELRAFCERLRAADRKLNSSE